MVREFVQGPDRVNNTGDVRINLTIGRVRVTVVAVAKQ